MSADDPRRELAIRLRSLREEHWPGLGITQLQLAEAFGGRKPLSISLISSWENPAKPKVPPPRRIEAYATFFATSRSVETVPYRLLLPGQLTDTERSDRDVLREELLHLRDKAIAEPAEPAVARKPALPGFWHFDDDYIVTIVCAQLPVSLQGQLGGYTAPDSPDYVALYTYADLDALIELHGHIRAANPDKEVHFKTAPELTEDDYTSHLVLLGGVDWNFVTRDLLERVELPVKQVARPDESHIGGFEVRRGDKKELIKPHLTENGRLVKDVGHFYRGVNPFNSLRTVTICNGMFGRGTYGVVRALTDVRFRDRNSMFLAQHFKDAQAFSVITRVSVVNGQVVTPDWTLPETRLHEWVESPG